MAEQATFGVELGYVIMSDHGSTLSLDYGTPTINCMVSSIGNTVSDYSGDVDHSMPGNDFLLYDANSLILWFCRVAANV
jgi:hypothetical protein